MESPLGLALAERLIGVVAIAIVLALSFAGRAGAVGPGRNGLLLVGAPQGTVFSAPGAAAPQVHVAACSGRAPDALWTVRPDGTHLTSVGPGSVGQFSPGGRSLLISDQVPCYSPLSLSLSFLPFRTERPIPGAAGGGSGYASPGSWLGPERPSVFDDSGHYLDALTGRRLLPGDGYLQATGGAQGVASCDGRVVPYSPTPSSLSIVTPVRSGRSLVAARRLIVAPRKFVAPGGAQWSPDGRYLFYVLYRAGSSSLWRVGSNGAGRRLLYTTPHLNPGLVPTLSPDGRWVLLFSVLRSGGETLSLIGSDGRDLHPLVTATAGATVSATAEWSPRGDQLFVVEDRTSTGTPPNPFLGPTTRVAFVVRPNGRARHVVPYPITAPPRPYPAATGRVLWSPDERDLAYQDGSGLVIAPVAGGPTRTILTAAVPAASNGAPPASLSISDWQAVPGTGRPFKCLDGRPPF